MAGNEKKGLRRIGINKRAISLCMIVRNEEEYLDRCIRSVRDGVDEIIVVDTGSEDRTVEIARNLGASVHCFQWNDSFSDARNFSLEQASGEWILVLDADETTAPADVGKIRNLADGGADGYLFTYRSYSRKSNDIRWIANDGRYREGDGWDGWIEGKVVRMFRRDSRIRFSGAVHELVDPSIRSFGGTLQHTDIIIHHFHELKGEERLREKQLQYLRICEKNLEESPDNPKTYYDMGLICRYVLKDLPKAIAHQKRALELNPDFEGARLELAITHHLEGDSRAAAAEITILLNRNPDCAPALLLCGIILEKRGKVERALECYRRVARLNPNLIDARVNAGTLLFKKGDFEEARTEWEAAHKVNPSNTRVLLNLGALDLRDGRYDSAERFLKRVLEDSPDNALLWNNMGVLHAGQGRDQEALEAFAKAVKLNPSFADARRNLEVIQNKMAVTV